MMRRTCFALPLLTLLLSAPAGAGNGTPLQLQGSGPYYRLTVPVQAYALAQGRLDTLHIRNAAGNPVPFAWLDDDAQAPAPQSQQLPFMAVPRREGGQAGAELNLLLKPDGSLKLGTARPAASQGQDWIIDASRVSGALLQLQLTLSPEAMGIFNFQLDGSNDLRRWQPLDEQAQVLHLRQGAATLSHNTLDLQAARWRYLRLVSRNAPLPITGVSVLSQPESSARRTLQWSAPIQADHCDTSSCFYIMPPHTPIDSLRLRLQEVNTVAQVRIDGLLPAQAAAPMQRRHRNPLYVLRHKPAEPPPANPQRTEHLHMALDNMLAYRLAREEGEARSPDRPQGGEVFPALRLTPTGALTQLGNPPPVLQIGTMPRELVFLAQGSPPFQLVFDQKLQAAAASTLMPLEQLIPGYQRSAPLSAGTATLELPAPSPATWQSTGLAAPQAAASVPQAKTAEPDGQHRYWLWGILAGALVLMGLMAKSLLAPPRSDAR